MRAFLRHHAARLVEGAIVTFARFVCAPRVILETDLSPRRARVMYANHTSNADTVLIWAALPPEMRRRTRPVAAADYWFTSPLRAFVGGDVFRVLPVERRPEHREGDPVADMAEALDGGMSLVIFPEGKRNQGPDALLPFKTGIFHLAARRPRTEFVPVWIENLNGVLPKGEKVPVPLICTLRFGPPVTLRPGEEKGAFLERARAALTALAPEGAFDAPPPAAEGRPAAEELPDGG